MGTETDSSQETHAYESFLPITKWLPDYDQSWFRTDLIAGLTVAAAVIPGGLAYASLAEMPPQTGLYAALMGAVIYVFFASSRQVIVGPTSPLAILLLAGVGPVAASSGGNYIALVSLTTIFVGLIGVAAWVFRLGSLVNFISGSVLTGFATGAGLYIISTQLGKLTGISGASGTFFQRIYFIGTHLNEIQSATLVVGLVSIVLLLLGKRYFPKLPTTLFVVLIAIVASSVLNLQALGVAIVGTLDSGLPPLTIPSIPNIDVIAALVPVAFALFILSYVQGIGAVQTFARRNGYRADPDQELLADGVANLGAGLFGGFAIGGSMSRSALNDSMGAKSQVVSAVVTVVLVVVLLFLTGLFTTLPEATLGAVVAVAVSGIIDVPGMQRLRNISRSEFIIAFGAFFGVLALGMLWGVFIGVGLSIIHVISVASHPETDVLARVPGTDHFIDKEADSDAAEDPGVLVYRVDSSIFYANTNPARDALEEHIDEREPDLELVVFDLSSSPMVDLATVEMFEDLHSTLSDRDIDLRISGANKHVRQLLKSADLDEKLGGIEEEETTASTIDRWRRGQGVM